ncbi:hypothetical protein Bp8pS_164 [Bacillus phage vB_BpuM-BpSp]|nr:hypothetical protein Bp8pS_164 [Bacillus phage vB_BpuM-BpSp]
MLSKKEYETLKKLIRVIYDETVFDKDNGTSISLNSNIGFGETIELYKDDGGYVMLTKDLDSDQPDKYFCTKRFKRLEEKLALTLVKREAIN